MLEIQRFSFTAQTNSFGQVISMPYLPLTLSNNNNLLQVMGLLDTVENFSPLLLAFAWTRSRDVPMILGHLNFFAEFNVCFYGHELAFEICPRKK